MALNRLQPWHKMTRPSIIRNWQQSQVLTEMEPLRHKAVRAKHQVVNISLQANIKTVALLIVPVAIAVVKHRWQAMKALM